MNELDVRELRKSIGLTQRELADRIGITPRAVQKWEAGGVIPESKKRLLLSLIQPEDELSSPSPSIVNAPHGSQAVGDGARAVNGEGVKECLEIVKQQQESISKLVETVNRLTKIISER